MSKEKDSNSWMQQLWRPMMGWMYMLICLLDMAVFPILWSLLQAMMHQPITQWNPLTLQGAGLFHIAMGAVLGIAAFGRTQEKLAGTAANPTATVATQNMNMSGNTAGGYGSGMNNMSGGFNNAPSFGNTSTFGQPAPGSFGSAPPAFGSAPPAFGATPAPSFGAAAPACPTTGKPLGPAQSFPAL
jgi:Holin of 3TMs, for gene-transfer release